MEETSNKEFGTYQKKLVLDHITSFDVQHFGPNFLFP